MAAGEWVKLLETFIASTDDRFLSTLAASFLSKAPLAAAWFGSDRRCRFANARFSGLFGSAPETLIGLSIGEALGDAVAGQVDCLGADGTDRFEIVTGSAGNDSRHLTGALISHCDPDGGLTGFLVVLEDVTELRRAIETLSRRDQFVAALMDATVDGIMTIDARGTIQAVNRACCRLFGYDEEELVGARVDRLMPTPHTARHTGYIDTYLTSGRAKIIGIGREVLAKRQDGTVFPIHLSVGEVRFGDEDLFIGIARDISDRHAAEERARFLTNHDPLTGLLSRRPFLEECDRLLATRLPRADETHVAFAFDVDQFREINEGLGYHVGDGVLKTLVGRFTETLPKEAILCRVGADEFAAFVRITDREAAETLAQVLHSRVSAPMYIERHMVLVRISIGAALFEPSVRRVEELLTKAELALQTVQHQGGNLFCFYTPEMAAAAGRRTLLSMHLAHAVQRDELSLVYQPIVEARTGKIASAEALLRWNHGTLGAISPGEFIPIAEDSGLIVSITDWVLESVWQQVAHWHRQGLGGGRVFLNVSGQQFLRGKLTTRLAELMTDHPQLVGQIGIEITEQAAVKDLKATIKAIGDLASISVETAIDDFGTGYSSLSYVQQLPITKLKIDRMFVDGTPHNQKNAALVRAVVGMAHGLGLTVVAEGVETAAQRDFLVDVGCDLLQGFFFSRPVPPDVFSGLLAQTPEHWRSTVPAV
jgi:PAS domain S-box-containing protein/diguanylate cyclase (GGDEF)-like protein